MTLMVSGVEFDNVDYDADADVLYLHVGSPDTAVDFDETPEGHAVRFDARGQVVGLTLVRPRHLLETTGEIRVTLPMPSSLAPADLAPILR